MINSMSHIPYRHQGHNNERSRDNLRKCIRREVLKRKSILKNIPFENNIYNHCDGCAIILEDNSPYSTTSDLTETSQHGLDCRKAGPL